MKKYLLLVIIIFAVQHVFSQEKSSFDYEKRSRFLVNFGAGFDIPIGKIPSETPVDGLFRTNALRGYLQLFSATYFSRKKLGGEFSLSLNTNPDTGFYVFSKKLDELYGEKYFVSSTITTYQGSDPGVTILAGPVYKITSGRFMFVPKLMFGIAIQTLHEAYVMLKEKDANTFIDISYLPKHNSIASFQVSPAFTVSYRLKNRFALNIDARYMWAQATQSYEETSYNYKTDETTITNYNDKRILQSIRIGAGISLLIK